MKFQLENEIRRVLQQEVIPPDGLLERIKANIDRLDSEAYESKVRKISLFSRYTIYSIGVAATLALILLLVDLAPKPLDSKRTTIIYSEAVGSQHNAELVANKALQLFSDNIKKGN